MVWIAIFFLGRNVACCVTALFLLRAARYHGRGGAVMSGLRQDVPALLPLPALQRQRTVAVILQLGRGRCVRDGRGAAAALPPAAGAHHPVSAHTGRKGRAADGEALVQVKMAKHMRAAHTH